MTNTSNIDDILEQMDDMDIQQNPDLVFGKQFSTEEIEYISKNICNNIMENFKYQLKNMATQFYKSYCENDYIMDRNIGSTITAVLNSIQPYDIDEEKKPKIDADYQAYLNLAKKITDKKLKELDDKYKK